MRKLFLCLVGWFIGGLTAQENVMQLWFDQPAPTQTPATENIFTNGGLRGMNNALPLGNGKLGALVFGGVDRERLVINEETLWTGGKNPSGAYETMGEYRALGNLWLEFNYGDAAFNESGTTKNENYRRSLDLATAQTTTKYTVGDVEYTREAFVSAPDNVIVMRISASQAGSLSGTIFWQDANGAKITALAAQLRASGELANGLQFATLVQLVNRGGALEVIDDKINFTACDELLIFVAVATDYAMSYEKNYRSGDNPSALVTAAIAAATTKTWDELQAAHRADYAQWYDRVKIDLGESTPAQRAMPTDKRRMQLVKQCDPEMEALLFNLGRYLLISSSRPGTLPANLQGIWNDLNNPPWHSDYHTNINIQMNYWLSEVANLSETHLPLFALISSQIPEWRTETAADTKKWQDLAKDAWAVRTSHNTMGGMGWRWDDTANAWYAHHFWEHFAFTQDKEWLKNTAYPLMRDVANFWLPHLKEVDGKLLVTDMWSPEHGPEHEDGVSYSQQIVWNHFNNTIEAATILDVDPELREKLTIARDKLLAPKIGKWGQLMEWMVDRDDPKDTHRHTSHLFAVYPGRQISVANTPKLADAAKISLVARTDGGGITEWALAWRTSLYARLRDAAAAHRQVHKFAEKTCPNLFGDHPPMQIDGNFGIAAGIAEMLLQSHTGTLELLPALPAEWKNGFVHGLRARGGYEVDLDWRDGKLSKAVIKNINGAEKVTVSYDGKTATVTLKRGASSEVTF